MTVCREKRIAAKSSARRFSQRRLAPTTPFTGVSPPLCISRSLDCYMTGALIATAGVPLTR